MIGVENAPEPTALLQADEPGAASINYKITQDNRKEARDYADRCDIGFGSLQQAVNNVSALAGYITSSDTKRSQIFTTRG